MDKLKVTKLFRTTKVLVSKHSPEILTGFGIAGMLATTVLSVKATPKALQLIEAEKERLELEKDGKLTPVEVVKVAWKPYIPAAIICVTSIACVVGASSVSMRRNAALATAYKLSETAFSEYKEKVIETIGDKKEKAVREKVAQDRIEKNPVSKNEVFITEKGNTLCFDPISGRYFKSDMDRIRKAENEINKMLNHEMYASLNDFYEKIGLSGTSLGDSIGWKIEKGLLNIEFDPLIAEDDTPCISIEYNIAPQYGYDKLV